MAERTRWQGGTRLIAIGAVVAVAGALVWIGSLVVSPTRSMHAYLAAWAFVTSTVVGALTLLMTFHAARSVWPVVLRRLLEAITAVLPLLTLFAVPLVVGASLLYPWAAAAPADEALQHLHEHQRPWFNVHFFALRKALYLVSWNVLALLLRRWSLRQDEDGIAGWSERQYRLSAVGLVVVAFTLTFASFDLLMSLTPGWVSTTFGVYVFAGGFLAALALLVVVALAAGHASLLDPALRAGHLRALGKLLFAFTIFWAYIAYSQFFVHWIADIPREVGWWVPRVRGWSSVSVLLIAGQFVVPFALLLSRDLKQRPAFMVAISIWILCFHALDLYWLVLPSIDPDGPRLHASDAGAFAFVIGAAVAFGAWRARGHSLVALRAPGLAASARYEGT